MNFPPFLACMGGFGFGDSPLISAILLAIYAIPVAAFANLILLFSIPLKHRAIHGAVFGAGVLMAFVLFSGQKVPGEIRLVCGALIPNIVAAQFVILVIKAWRSRRDKGPAVMASPNTSAS